MTSNIEKSNNWRSKNLAALEKPVTFNEIPQKQVRFDEPEEEAEDDGGNEEIDELPFIEVAPVERVPRVFPERTKTNYGNNEPIPDLSRKTPAYRVKAPIEREDTITDVVEKLLRTIPNLDIEEILGASEPTRKELMRLLSKKRTQTKADLSALQAEAAHLEQAALPFDSWIDDDEEPYLRGDAISVNSLPPALVLLTNARKIGRVPAGALIMDDPVLQYLASLAPGEDPKQIYVAKDSQSLRSVYPYINGMKTEESVTDGGSQIVSMAETVAKNLGIAWDPDIKIHMQSANNQIEMTLGLARNVPFLFGDITVHLQVHIIREPAYRVLLGRPFDVLTESLVANSADGGQTITIKDPNTGRRSTIPTYARGSDPEIAKKKPKTGFQ